MTSSAQEIFFDVVESGKIGWDEFNSTSVSRLLSDLCILKSSSFEATGTCKAETATSEDMEADSKVIEWSERAYIRGQLQAQWKHEWESTLTFGGLKSLSGSICASSAGCRTFLSEAPASKAAILRAYSARRARWRRPGPFLTLLGSDARCSRWRCPWLFLASLEWEAENIALVLCSSVNIVLEKEGRLCGSRRFGYMSRSFDLLDVQIDVFVVFVSGQELVVVVWGIWRKK